MRPWACSRRGLTRRASRGKLNSLPYGGATVRPCPATIRFLKLLGAETGWEILPLAVLNKFVPHHAEEHQQNDRDHESPQNFGSIMAKEGNGIFTPVLPDMCQSLVRVLRL